MSPFCTTQIQQTCKTCIVLIESINTTNRPKKAVKELLSRRGHFSITALETLQPHGLSQELNPVIQICRTCSAIWKINTI